MSGTRGWEVGHKLEQPGGGAAAVVEGALDVGGDNMELGLSLGIGGGLSCAELGSLGHSIRACSRICCTVSLLSLKLILKPL